ncbi:hypothetical protein BM525_19075 (plasmid) [Alteromonas mediterranea]|uniref:Uncharacterized protein n=2 Tax=Alteromonas mediterranea TaxID=314275 RepID=A0AAC9JHD9_9ALTE|nr:hypothetical protein BM524_18880 [Alteromonas mediterranea]APD99841.1 hypothetical protein BM525_19075 [Alteromonas mediterranea]
MAVAKSPYANEEDNMALGHHFDCKGQIITDSTNTPMDQLVGLVTYSDEGKPRVYLNGKPNEFAALNLLTSLDGVSGLTPVYDEATHAPLGMICSLSQYQRVLDSVVKVLDPDTVYTFETTSAKTAGPMTPGAFLASSQAREAILGILDGPNKIWCAHDGWQKPSVALSIDN